MNRLLVCIAVGTLVLLSSCTPRTKKVAKTTEKGDIVLILNDIPVNYRFYHGRTGGHYAVLGGNHEIKYYAKGIIPSEFHPDYTRDKDTIVIKSVSSAIEIQHKYNGLEVFSFIAQPKDTLYFSYKDKMPTVSSSRKGKKHDLDYEELIRKNERGEEYSAFAKFSAPYFAFSNIEKYGNLKGEELKKARKKDEKLFYAENYKKSIVQLDKEEKILDSLIAKDYLSEDVSDFYKQRIKYRRLKLENRNNKTASFKDIKQDDKLLKYSFYRSIISSAFYYDILNMIEFKKPANYYDYNSEEVYDAIQKAPGLTYGTKKLLSYSWFKIIIESSTNEKISEYFTAFKSAYGKDTNLITTLIEEHNLNQVVSDDMELVDDSGIKTSFKTLLKKYKGKLLYVDFWASWCSPCRREMPASHKLKEEYKGKDVVFVYLAYKDKAKAWKRALKGVDLVDEENSYLIKNNRTSMLLESLNVKRIPRFMIFNKEGKLVLKNAPRPGTKKIRKILNKLLKHID